MSERSFGWHRCLCVLATLSLTVACGGRTDMLLDDNSRVESGGTGGGTGGTSGSTGGSSTGGSTTGGSSTGGSSTGGNSTGGNSTGGSSIGGTGGAGATGGAAGSGGSMACAPLSLSAPPISFSQNNSSHRATPLLSLTASTSTVAVAVAEMPVESPVGAAAGLRVTGFEPWGTVWPDSLGQGTLAPFVVGVDQFAIDRGLAGETISVVYPASPSPPAAFPSGVLFQAAFDVFGGNSANAISLLDTSADSQLVRFLETGTSGSLAGALRTLSNSGQDFHELVFCMQPQELNGGFCLTDACGTEDVDADAVALDEGFLVAYSSSRGFGECMNDDGIVGLPSRILVAFVGGPGGGYGPLPVEIEQPGDMVRFVRLIPHSEGAWLVYQYAGLNAEQPPPLMAMRIRPDGTVLLGATAVLDGSQFFAEPALAAIGDQLLVGWVDAFDPNGEADIMLRVLDDGANELTQNMHHVPSVPSRLSALGSPDAMHVLIGWSEQTGMDGAGEDQAFVARFSCGWGQI